MKKQIHNLVAAACAVAITLSASPKLQACSDNQTVTVNLRSGSNCQPDPNNPGHCTGSTWEEGPYSYTDCSFTFPTGLTACTDYTATISRTDRLGGCTSDCHAGPLTATYTTTFGITEQTSAGDQCPEEDDEEPSE